MTKVVISTRKFADDLTKKRERVRKTLPALRQYNANTQLGLISILDHNPIFEKQYGFLVTVNQNRIITDINVIDENKYTLFLLKYGK